jgi:hypothetical protein
VRRISLFGIGLLAVLAPGCGSLPEEFAYEGVVAGQVVCFKCSNTTPPVCRHVPMPRRAWKLLDHGILYWPHVGG